MGPPSLTTTVRIARSPQTVSEHLLLGLVTGGLLGPQLIIERREANNVCFTRAGGVFPTVPDRGEIVLSEDAPGETVLECRLWCHGMGRRRLTGAVLLGGVTATIGALGFGWLVPISISVGVAVAVAWDVYARSRDLAHLRRRFEAFVRNTNYLKTM